jgi:hypothetical protein
LIQRKPSSAASSHDQSIAHDQLDLLPLWLAMVLLLCVLVYIAWEIYSAAL